MFKSLARMALATATAAALFFTTASCSAPQQAQDSDESAQEEPPVTIVDTTAETEAESTPQQQKADITEDRAKAVALTHAKVDGEAASFTKVVLDENDGTLVYEIEFTAHGAEYSYEIDATTGNVLSYDEPEQDDELEQDD